MEDNKNIVTTNEAETIDKPVEEPAKIIFEPLEFDDDASTMFITARLLKEKVDNLFRAVFNDYDGCIIQINDGQKPNIIVRTIQQGGIYVDLVFRESGNNNGCHAIKRRSDMKNNSMLSRIEYTIGSMSARGYVITDEAKQSLSQLLPRPFNAREDTNYASKINWDERTMECLSVPTAGYYTYGINGGASANVTIIGFPIETIIGVLYDGFNLTDEDYAKLGIDKEKHDYGCKIINTTNDKDILLQITQLKKSAVNKIYRLMNIQPMNAMGYYSNPMVNGSGWY